MWALAVPPARAAGRGGWRAASAARRAAAPPDSARARRPRCCVLGGGDVKTARPHPQLEGDAGARRRARCATWWRCAARRWPRRRLPGCCASWAATARTRPCSRPPSSSTAASSRTMGPSAGAPGGPAGRRGRSAALRACACPPWRRGMRGCGVRLAGQGCERRRGPALGGRGLALGRRAAAGHGRQTRECAGGSLAWGCTCPAARSCWRVFCRRPRQPGRTRWPPGRLRPRAGASARRAPPGVCLQGPARVRAPAAA